MEAKTNTSRILMSDILKENVTDIDQSSSDVITGYIHAIVAVVVGEGAIETIVGSTVTFLLDEQYELEIRVMTDDAIGLSLIWPNIKIAGFELHYVEEIISIKGPFKVSALRVQDIDQQRQMCVLAMKLCKE